MGALGVQSVEARDVAEYSAVRRTAYLLVPNVSSTQLITLVTAVPTTLLDASGLSLLMAMMLDVSVCILHDAPSVSQERVV